jgi:hypothetical protein
MPFLQSTSFSIVLSAISHDSLHHSLCSYLMYKNWSKQRQLVRPPHDF